MRISTDFMRVSSAVMRAFRLFSSEVIRAFIFESQIDLFDDAFQAARPAAGTLKLVSL